MMHRRSFVRGAALAAGAAALTVPAVASSALNPELWTGPDPTPTLPHYLKGLPAVPGSDAEALAEAKALIKKNRVKTTTVKLVDLSGAPLANATVQVKQLNHSFPFGEQNYIIDRLANDGRWDTFQADAWRTVFPTLFNALNCTCYWTEKANNTMKRVEEHQGDVQLDSFARVVEWATANGLQTKGHPIFWPVDKAIPQWLRRYDYPTQLKFLEVRVRSLVARFKDQVRTWDLVNEMMWEPALKNLNKRIWPYLETEQNLVEYIGQILTWAREEDPTATFLLNEYGVENDEKPNLKDQYGQDASAATQRKRYVSLYKALHKAGTLPNAIGLQSHSGAMLTPRQQWQVYNEVAETGVPIHITEFWIPKERHQQLKEQGKTQNQIWDILAQQTVDYITTAVAHPRVNAFYCWSLIRDTILFDESDKGAYTLTPVYERVRDLWRKDWWVKNQKLTTNAKGEVTLTGFAGEYEVSCGFGVRVRM